MTANDADQWDGRDGDVVLTADLVLERNMSFRTLDADDYKIYTDGYRLHCLGTMTVWDDTFQPGLPPPLKVDP